MTEIPKGKDFGTQNAINRCFIMFDATFVGKNRRA